MSGKGSSLTDINSVAGNWNISTVSTSAELYKLALVNVFGTSLGQEIHLPENVNREFVFDIAPKSIEMEEPAAVTIVPTQNGQFIEHQGNIFKNITISGTTGLRPGKRRGNILGSIIPTAKDDIAGRLKVGLPFNEVTGFEILLNLRNMFRAYFDIKRDPNLAHQVAMLWSNGKEGEFYIVEPLSFRTKRDSSSPVTFAYDLVLKTIDRVDIPKISKTAQEEIADPNSFATRMARNLRLINNALATVSTIPEAFVAVVAAPFNTILEPATQLAANETFQHPVKSVFRPASDFLSALTPIKFIKGSLGIDRKSSADLASNSLELFNNLQQTEARKNGGNLAGTATINSTAWHAVKDIFRAATSIYGEDSLFADPIGTTIANRTIPYIHPVTGQPISGGSPTDLNNVSTPAGTSTSVVNAHDTIFSISSRLLGDQARWKELVILNNLKYPYIDPTGDGVSVLRPNDAILTPASPTFSSVAIKQDLTVTQSKINKRMGRDIRLKEVGGLAGTGVFDAVINSKGDLDTIEGTENLEQAVRIKFSTERGSLPTHPQFGIAAPIGSKALFPSLISFQLDTRASLLRDSRISNINSLSFNVVGNTLSVKANLEVAGVDSSVSISFDARR